MGGLGGRAIIRSDCLGCERLHLERDRAIGVVVPEPPNTVQKILGEVFPQEHEPAQLARLPHVHVFVIENAFIFVAPNHSIDVDPMAERDRRRIGRNEKPQPPRKAESNDRTVAGAGPASNEVDSRHRRFE
jgi:hypothetical protein